MADTNKDETRSQRVNEDVSLKCFSKKHSLFEPSLFVRW